jgi:hypothetical protein
MMKIQNPRCQDMNKRCLFGSQLLVIRLQTAAYIHLNGLANTHAHSVEQIKLKPYMEDV